MHITAESETRKLSKFEWYCAPPPPLGFCPPQVAQVSPEPLGYAPMDWGM